MNKRAVLAHLKEAHEQLVETIRNIETDPEYEIADFRVEMSHLYNHLNTAWNGKEADESSYAELSSKNFSAWRKFPENGDLFLDS